MVKNYFQRLCVEDAGVDKTTIAHRASGGRRRHPRNSWIDQSPVTTGGRQQVRPSCTDATWYTKPSK